MKRQIQLIVTFAIALLSPSLVFCQGENPEVRKEIQKFYAQWDKAVMDADVKTLSSMIHKSFVQTHADGKTSNAAQVKKEMSEMIKMGKDTKCKITVDQIQSQGNEAVAWVTMKMSFKFKQGNKWEPVSFVGKYAETLKKFDGKWMFVASQELP